MSGGEGGTRPPTLEDTINSIAGILTGEVVGYDPNDPNASEHGVTGGMFGFLDFGEANTAVAAAASVAVFLFGRVGAAKRAVERTLEQVGEALSSALRHVGDWFTGIFQRASRRARRSLGTSTGLLDQLTPHASRQAKQRILEVLESGDSFSRDLAARIRSGQVRLRFRRLAGNTEGIVGRPGSSALYLDSRLASVGEETSAAITAVHEMQHLADDFVGTYHGVDFDRIAELRAFSREARFAASIDRLDLSEFAQIRQNNGLQVAIEYVDKLYGF